MIVLARDWWSFLVRGLIAVLVGIVTFLAPGLTLGALVILFGAYALVDGVLSIVAAWRASRSQERWSMLLLEGVVGIVAAGVTMAWPAITAFALVFVVAAWAIVTGVLEIVAAVRLRKYITGEWLLALGGIASILFGLDYDCSGCRGACDCPLDWGIRIRFRHHAYRAQLPAAEVDARAS